MKQFSARSLQTVLLVVAIAACVGFNLVAIITEVDAWSAAALVALVTAFLSHGLVAPRLWAWLVWLALVVIGLAATVLHMVPPVLDLVAVGINAAVGWMFARTLLPGREPLITALARLVGGQAHVDEPGVRSYSRTLTKVWAGIMFGQALLLLMAWLALYGGFVDRAGAARFWLEAYLRYGSYIVTGLFFVLEYPWRRHYLPQATQLPFSQMLRRVADNWQQVLHRDVARP